MGGQGRAEGREGGFGGGPLPGAVGARQGRGSPEDDEDDWRQEDVNAQGHMQGGVFEEVEGDWEEAAGYGNEGEEGVEHGGCRVPGAVAAGPPGQQDGDAAGGRATGSAAPGPRPPPRVHVAGGGSWAEVEEPLRRGVEVARQLRAALQGVCGVGSGEGDGDGGWQRGISLGAVDRPGAIEHGLLRRSQGSAPVDVMPFSIPAGHWELGSLAGCAIRSRLR